MKKTFLSSRQELRELILELTEIAKTKSVLALPEKYYEIDDDFMKYALQSVVDGVGSLLRGLFGFCFWLWESGFCILGRGLEMVVGSIEFHWCERK